MAQYGLGVWEMDQYFGSGGYLQIYVDGAFYVFNSSSGEYVQAKRLTAQSSIFWGDSYLKARLLDNSEIYLYTNESWKDSRCRKMVVASCEDPDVEEMLSPDGHLVSPIKLKNNSNWIRPDCKIKINGEWKQFVLSWAKINGTWRVTITE